MTQQADKKIINKIILVVIIILAIIAIVAIARARVIDTHDSVKKAIFKSEIPEGEDYIIARWTRVTGFDWELVEDDPKLSPQRRMYCNIKGPNPNDLRLCYNFDTGHNKYVFYVTERREFFDEELGEQSLEYTVSGWDILYPVNHGFGNTLRTNRHITTKDLVSETQPR